MLTSCSSRAFWRRSVDHSINSSAETWTYNYWKQESELQSAINTPASTNNSEASPMIGFDGLVSNPQLAADAFSLFPSRGQAAHLWQIFLNNVDVLLKVLHIPTTQPAVFAAINNPKAASKDLNALLFSIYFAAVTSLRQADSHIIFGEDRQSVLKRFQRGLEVSLHSAEFLDSPTIVSLQAISIYLVNLAAPSSVLGSYLV